MFSGYVHSLECECFVYVCVCVCVCVPYVPCVGVSVLGYRFPCPDIAAHIFSKRSVFICFTLGAVEHCMLAKAIKLSEDYIEHRRRRSTPVPTSLYEF